MRVKPSVRRVIDAAAKLKKVDRTVFIQQAALAEAQEVIANQKDFLLDEKAFAAFGEALSKPAARNEDMANLLNRKSPWE